MVSGMADPGPSNRRLPRTGHRRGRLIAPPARGSPLASGRRRNRRSSRAVGAKQSHQGLEVTNAPGGEERLHHTPLPRPVRIGLDVRNGESVPRARCQRGSDRTALRGLPRCRRHDCRLSGRGASLRRRVSCTGKASHHRTGLIAGRIRGTSPTSAAAHVELPSGGSAPQS